MRAGWDHVGTARMQTIEIEAPLRNCAPLPALRGAVVNAMDTRTLDWNWRGETIRLGADASGAGPTVLLLPALSSISSRREMRPVPTHDY